MTAATTAAAPAGSAQPAMGVSELMSSAVENHQAGRLREAEGFYRAALEQAPASLPALVGRGQVMEQLGEFEEGARMLGRAVTVDNANADLQVMLAGLLMQIGRLEEAIDHARRGAAIDASHVRARTMLAEILGRAHRLDEAIAEIETARAIDADDPIAILMMANLLRRRDRPAEARPLLETLIAGDEGPHVERAWSELGFVLDTLGEHDDAFEAFGRAGRERAGGVADRRVDRNLWSRALAGYRDAVTPELLARHADLPERDPGVTPAFLVGFPRSGTTMTEQALAAHPAVVTTDEQPFVLELLATIARHAQCPLDHVPGALASLDADTLVQLRAQYRRRIATVPGAASATTVVDKLPLNLMHVGLINLLFPEAKIIVALRDPRDVCLSCFIQRFGLNPAMINFLWWDRTIEFYADVMSTWLALRDRLTAAFIEVRYEDTVADLEGQVRRMLDLLGLDWDPAVLAFHEQARDRVISTPSFAAVTEPISPKAVGRWRNYERHFDAAATTLQPFVEAFGYS